MLSLTPLCTVTTQMTGSNLLNGTITTELGRLTSLTSLCLCKIDGNGVVVVAIELVVIA